MSKIIRPSDSIFLKILLIFIVAAAANIAVMRTFVRNFLFDDERRLHRAENMLEYGKLLSAKWPYPPAQDSLIETANRLHLKIHVRGPGLDLASEAGLPSSEVISEHFIPRVTESKAKSGRWEDYLVLEVEGAHGETWDFFLESENTLESHPSLLLVPLSALLLILLACYAAVRLLLRPLTQIEKGVAAVAGGDLESRLPVVREDELGKLTDSFNQMTTQLKTMMSAKEQLLLDVSHEFRSPLTRIRVAMELPASEGRESILRSVGELEAMLRELLESARLNDPKGTLRKESTDLGAMIRELVEIHEDQRPGLKVVALPESLYWHVDPARLQIVLRNLVENSIKYSSKQARPVEISAFPFGDKLRIEVRDYGIGVPAEDQTLIFEPFYRVDRSRIKSTGGYGLGLALCRKIVNAHGGRLWVESRPGEGALFIVEVPG